MPTIKKQNKSKSSNETDMLSDIDNLEIMLRGNILERERKRNLVTLAEGLIVRVMILQ